MERLLAAVRAVPARCGPVRVIAIDGGAAAGKTGLAERLSAALPDAAVLHLDDLLDGWAGQFGYRGRLHAKVLAPLAAGRPAGYRRYDWTLGRFADRVALPVPRYLLVEGVSALWGCSPFWSVGVFLDVPRAERERRWLARDGVPQLEWIAWLDAEDRFFAEHPVPAEAFVYRPGREVP
jgi:chloramphenicol 3-O-phosphotransferase